MILNHYSMRNKISIRWNRNHANSPYIFSTLGSQSPPKAQPFEARQDLVTDIGEVLGVVHQPHGDAVEPAPRTGRAKEKPLRRGAWVLRFRELS